MQISLTTAVLFIIVVYLSPQRKVDAGLPSLCVTPTADFSLTDCASWKAVGDCLLNPSYMWPLCQTTCGIYSTCECVGGSTLVTPDQNCTCGEMATNGLCETDYPNGLVSTCHFTCNIRTSPLNNCTAVPQGINLTANAQWQLSAPPNATLFKGRAAYLQTAVITCQKGYEVDNPSNNGFSICDPLNKNSSTGNWFIVNTNRPNCLPIQCPDPPDVPDAYYVNTTGVATFLYNSQALYYCEPGFVMAGRTQPAVATCTLTGLTGWSWSGSGAAPQCTPPPCQAAINGINVYFNISANQTGGIMTYSCLPGYNPSNSLSLFVKTCQNDGSWAPAGQPVCSIVHCGPPILEANAYFDSGPIVSQYQYGDTVTSRCTRGTISLYIKPGTDNTPLDTVTNMCDYNGYWTTNKLSCLRVQCSAPQSYEISSYLLQNSSAQMASLLYGVSILFACDFNQGYVPDGNQTTQTAIWYCNENATWEKQPLKCSQQGILMKLGQKTAIVTYQTSSAIVTATTILAILSFFIGVLVCMDYMTIVRDLHRLRHNWRQLVKRLRDERRINDLRHVRRKLKNSIIKERFIKKLETDKERQQLHAAGLVQPGGGDDGFLIANPLTAEVGAGNPFIRPLSGQRMPSHHVEALGMDIPETTTLRFALPDAGESLRAKSSATRI